VTKPSGLGRTRRQCYPGAELCYRRAAQSNPTAHQSATSPNKGMQLTRPGQVAASQLIPGVGRLLGSSKGRRHASGNPLDWS
jgi:hypothetical protein